MPVFDIEDIGKVTIRRSKLAKNAVIRILPSGQPSVTIPYRMPYYLAKKIIKQKKDWIKQHKKPSLVLRDGDAIGSYKIQFIPSNIKAPSKRVSNQKIIIKYPDVLDPGANDIQEIAHLAALKAIKNDAEDFLPPRLALLAKKHGYSYKEVRLRNMRSRWGSCSTQGLITLNIWLMTLPEELIEYVCCHELAHLDHHNHSQYFWKAVEDMLPNYRSLRKQIKDFKPYLQNLPSS